ncbi:hypothetical protein [Arsenicicoccus sp. oral taxon 190]|uniref:hypothetical protein n=1 Tax=Arsenicicoccus sp. oral taxon 190 TaxID=1658671 RepID=UPI00067B0FB7|nr:hypothetical protein [Arsenicicoccus sp. oral taxon 190]
MPPSTKTDPVDPADPSHPTRASGTSAPPRPATSGEGLLAAMSTVVEAADQAVPVEPNAANDIEIAEPRVLPWIGVTFLVFAALLVLWICYIAISLPSRQLSPNYDVAWAGFDVMLLLALVGTAWSVLRRSRFLAMAAGWTAGLLVTDAWFDTVTSPVGWDLVESVVLSVLVELPLAAVCVWLALRATDITERRIRLLQRRARRARPARLR